MKWIEELYIDIRNQAKENNTSFAIFYSHPYECPELMVIGDNPGGSQSESLDPCPGKGYHDYFTWENTDYDYRLARKMRAIFAGTHLTENLKSSVKLNRNFFRSRNLEKLKEMKITSFEYCKPLVREIIVKLKPKRIFTESYGALDFLAGEFGSKSRQNLVEHNGRVIMIRQVSDPFDVIGVSHPTGGRPPLSEDAIKKCNEALIKIWI